MPSQKYKQSQNHYKNKRETKEITVKIGKSLYYKLMKYRYKDEYLNDFIKRIYKDFIAHQEWRENNSKAQTPTYFSRKARIDKENKQKEINIDSKKRASISK